VERKLYKELTHKKWCQFWKPKYRYVYSRPLRDILKSIGAGNDKK